MERRSPYNHHQHHHQRDEMNHRYGGPLPPPPPLPHQHLRFSNNRDRDREFYHPHDRLPLPPPHPLPPPPLPPPQYYPIERRPPPTRIPLDHPDNRHHHLNSRFIEHHRPPPPPRFREPPPPEFHRVMRDPLRVIVHHPPPPPHSPIRRDFDRDMWDPPRVSVDRHLPIRSMSPYRRSPPPLIDSTSFHDVDVDMDIDSGDEHVVVSNNNNNRSQGFLFGKQKDDFRWGKNGTSTSTSSANFDFGRSVSPSSTFTFGKGKVFGSGEQPVVETIKWGSAEADHRNRFKNAKFVAKREESPPPQVFVHSPSPKPKPQRTSVLLRVGKPPNKWKDDDDDRFPSKYCDDSNAGSSDVRGVVDFAEERVDVTNAGSAVDLDVTFKSNALVAKAIVPPPGEVRASDGMSTPDNKKKRKIVTPVFSVSSPRVTGNREKTLSRDGSPQKAGAASSSKKPVANSRVKYSVTGAGTSLGIGSRLSLEEPRAPLEKNGTERTSLTAIYCPDNEQSTGDCPTVDRNVISSSAKSLVQAESMDTVSDIGSTSGVGFQPSLNRDNLPVENITRKLTPWGTRLAVYEDNRTPKVDPVSVSNEDLTHSKKEVARTAIATGVHVGPQPCLNGINVPLDNISTEISLLSGRACLDDKPLSGGNTSHLANLIQPKPNMSMCGNGAGYGVASQPWHSGADKTPSSGRHCSGKYSSDGGDFTQCMDADPNYKDLGSRYSEDKDATNGSVMGDVPGSRPCPNGMTVSLGAFAKEMPVWKTMVASDYKRFNEPGFAEKLDDISSFNKGLCLTESKDEVTVVGLRSAGGGSMACLDGVSMPVETTEKTILDATSSSIKGLTQLEDDAKITADGILEGTAVPSKAITVDKIPSSNTVSSGKDQYGRARSAHDLEVTSNSNRGSSLSNNMGVTRIGVATRSQSRLNGIAMPLEPNKTGRTLVGSMVDSDGVFPSKRKNESIKKKNVTLLDSGLPAPAAEVIMPDACLPPPVTDANVPGFGLEKKDANMPLESSMTKKVSLLLSVGSSVVHSPETIVSSTKKETKVTMPDSGVSAPATEVSMPITVPGLAVEANAPAPGLGSVVVSDVVGVPKTNKGAPGLGSVVVCAPKTNKRNRKKKCEVFVPGCSPPMPAIEGSVPGSGLLPVSEPNIPLSGFSTGVCEDHHKEIAGGDNGKLGSGSTKLEEEVSYENGEMVDDVCLHSSINTVNTSLKERNDMSVLSSSVGLEEELGQVDMSIASEKSNSGFEFATMLDKDEVPVSGIRSVVDVGLQAAQDINTFENNAEVELLSSSATVSVGARKRKRKRKKKAVNNSLGRSSSTVVETHKIPVCGDIIIHGAENASSTNKDLQQSEEHLTAKNMIEKEWVTVSHGESTAVKSIANVVVGSSEVPKVKKNVFERLSGFPSPRVKQIHEGPSIFDRLDCFVDASLGSEKLKEENTTSSNVVEKGNIQYSHGSTDLAEKSVAVEALPNHVASANTPKVKKIKKTKKILKMKKKLKPTSSISGLRGSQRDEMKNTASNDGVDASPIFDRGQNESKEGVCNTDNSVEEQLRINMVSLGNGIDKNADKHSAQENICSDSFVKDSTFLDGQSSSSLGIAGNWNKNIKSLVTEDHSLQYALPGDFLESDNGKRSPVSVDAAGEFGRGKGESPVSVDAAGEFGRGKGEDIAFQSPVKENYDNSPLGLPVSGFIVPSKGMENYTLSVKADSSSVSMPREEASGTSITNSNEEGIDSVPERHVNLDDQHSPCDDILNFPCTQCNESSKKRCRNCAPKSDPEDQTAHKKTLLSGAMQNLQPSFTLRPKVAGKIERKNRQGPSAPKLASGRVSFSPPYIKNSDSSIPTAGPRTWRRTANLPLPPKGMSLSTGQLQRESLTKTQGASYIRKGNSLVRNCAPATTIPKLSSGLSTSSFPLNHVASNASKISLSECKVNSLGPQNHLKTGLEMPRTPNLSHNMKLPNISAKFNHASQPFTYKEAAAHAGGSGNQIVDKDPETQELLDSGTSQSSKTNAVTYVKRRSNQLIASCGTEVYDCSLAAENTSSPPYDKYYKKNKNQLIRNAPSLGSHVTQVVPVQDDISNSESQRATEISSQECSRNLNKRKTDKAFPRTRKPSKWSLVWTSHGAQKEAPRSLQRCKVYPYLFPWKRTSQWRNLKFNFISRKSSFTRISKDLLLSRNRDAVYTRSMGGFSLRKSKVLSIGGSNLKWSKSIENRSKKANEEATLAVAAVERKKREQKNAGCAVPSAKRRNQSSRERIFRIGSVRYRMDASKRTLQRVPDEKSPSAVDHHAVKDTMKSFIPKRLLIDNDEYIRIGSGNQLVRDPKKLVRRLASEKVRWSLHTARLRLAKKQQYCQFFTRFGKCNKDDGRCPYMHDPSKIVVCTKFLKGLCTGTSCRLTHKVIPERMEDCSYFLQGLCTNESCPYRHVKVNPNASVCEGFLRGYCARGDECRKKHSYVCPIFESTGVCPRRPMCKLRHPKSQKKTKKQSQELKNARGRYFGSELNGTIDRGTVSSDKYSEKKSGGEDFLSSEGKLADYIGLDVSDEEWEDDNSIGKYTKVCDSEASDVESGELDELIKPMRLISKTQS